MKKVFVKGHSKHSILDNPQGMTNAHEFEGETLEVSDGYHTMDELYEHRIELFIALCRRDEWETNELGCSRRVWRSRLHSDGTAIDGWFILGVGKEPGEQITYHLPMSRWEETSFAETLERAPEFDGHTPADVLERLARL